MDWLRLIWACAVLSCMSANSFGQGIQGTHAGHEEPVVEPAKNYEECVARMSAQVSAAEWALGWNNGMAAGAAAYTISQLAKSLGRMALADTTIARDKVKSANLAGKQIANLAEEIHEAAEAGKLDDAKQRVAMLKELIAALGVIVLQKYICPMHCEGTKLYGAPGVCPVCGMELIPLGAAPYDAKVSAAKNRRSRQTDGHHNPAAHSGGRAREQTGHRPREHDLHFMLISEDLSFYAHEHPVRLTDGTFVLRGFTFPFGGKFVAYSDFTPTGSGNQISKTRVHGACGRGFHPRGR